MQQLATGTNMGKLPEEPVRVWIENGDGAIARGLLQELSVRGAFVRLIGTTLVTSGNNVTVRIAFSSSAPTLGASARVRLVRPVGDAAECELEWTHSGPEREQLAMLVSSFR
jgi:hypothetical protein